MKKISTVIMLLLAVITLSAQDITGKWTGVLSFQDQFGQDQALRINFNISATDAGYTSTLDSPDQGALGIPTDTTIFEKQELTIKMSQLMLEYVATLVDAASMTGKLTQAGQTMDLDLKKEE